MAKINIPFNNSNYNIDESSLASASSALKSHLSTVMNGSGATINLDGTTYNIDSTKLTSATNDFIAHLGTIAGSGSKVFVGGVECSVDSTKVAGAVSDLEIVLGDLHTDEGGSGESGDDYPAAGLYETGSNYTVMKKSWDTLVSENIIKDNGAIVPENRDMLAGDMVYHEEKTTANALTTYAGTKYITGVVIPKTIDVLNLKTFYNCAGLTSVVIKDGVKEIGQNSFSSNPNLVSIEIPNSMTNIGPNTFYNCPISAYNEYDNGLYLGNNNNPYVALMAPKDKDKSITSLNIHPDCNLIAGNALLQCSGLTNVVIPNGVVSICTTAFDRCTNLDSITIPDSVMLINYRAFHQCSNLTSINYMGTIEQWNAISKGKEWNNYVPATEVVCTDGTVTL